jgi:hypothetical protein
VIFILPIMMILQLNIKPINQNVSSRAEVFIG